MLSGFTPRVLGSGKPLVMNHHDLVQGSRDHYRQTRAGDSSRSRYIKRESSWR